MVALLLGNESSDLNRFILVTPKSENDVRLQATLDNQNPTGLPVGAVRFISFADVKQESWIKAENAAFNLIVKLFRENLFAADVLDPFTKKDYLAICDKKASSTDMESSLQFLTEVLAEYYGKKVILLIDEYDTPLVAAHQHGYYNEAVNFFKTLYSSALKDNVSIKFAVVTGILRVSNENIFSGLNNIVQYSILDKNYESSFGLSAKEVEKALDYYGLEKNMPLIKEWYDGYKFGDFFAYNPWSITNYLKEGETKPFWVNTSENYLINKTLSQADLETLRDFKKLLSGKSIEKIISNNITLKDIVEDSDVWALMLFSGYLTVEKKLQNDIYFLRIPNKEVMTFFGKAFL